MKNRSALLAGATGLVGGHCLTFLQEMPDIAEIRVLTRRPLTVNHPKIREHVVDFNHLDQYRDIITADHIFCCLGTTIKKAGSREAFQLVDYDYPYRIAEIAAKNGAENFLLVSALGANPKSKIFYNRVKGELEKAVSSLPFAGILIFHPSLLLGQREEFRAGEKAGAFLFRLVSPFLAGKLTKYRPIQAQAVAKAMVYMAPTRLKGVHIFESDQIKFFANRLSNAQRMEHR